MSALAEALVAAQAELPCTLGKDADGCYRGTGSRPWRSKPIRERLLSRVVAGSGGCWIWTGARDRLGYGHISDGEKARGAHRVSYEIHVGPIPPGLSLDHLCRNRACVNPAHLEPVTHRENVLRGTSPLADQARQTHCKRGHEFSPDNTYIIPSTGSRVCRTCARKPRACAVDESGGLRGETRGGAA